MSRSSSAAAEVVGSVFCPLTLSRRLQCLRDRCPATDAQMRCRISNVAAWRGDVAPLRDGLAPMFYGETDGAPSPAYVNFCSRFPS